MPKKQPATKWIVVGLDHTPAGSAALRWAVAEAKRTGQPVFAVHVFDRTRRADLATLHDPEAARSLERIEAHRHVVDVVGNDPGVNVALSQLDGSVAAMLERSAAKASMLVLGEPSTDATKGLPEELGRRCRCPVTVVSEDGAARPANAYFDVGFAG